MKRHYPAIRGIAIFLVILHHAIVLGTSIPIEWGYNRAQGLGGDALTVVSLFGWVAVPIFLFISGSFYAYAARGEPPQISFKIVKTNLIGILWPYLIWSLVYYLVEWIGVGTSFSIWATIKNLLTGYPYNFVPLIVFYILVSPILIKLAQRIGWLSLLGVISAYQLFLILKVDSIQYGLLMPGWTDNLVVPVLSRTMADWGIYFPLGLYLALNTKKATPILERTKWLFIVFGLIAFGLTAGHALRFIKFPLSRHIFPLMLVFAVPVLRREWIPARRFFEAVGKHAYGLYLTHLVMINIFLLSMRAIFPWLLAQPYIIHLSIFLVALFVPLWLINWINRSRLSRLSPYLFG